MFGLITPIRGLLLFVVANITKRPLMSVVKELFPFIVALFVALAIITFMSVTVLLAPGLFGYRG